MECCLVLFLVYRGAHRLLWLLCFTHGNTTRYCHGSGKEHSAEADFVKYQPKVQVNEKF